MRIGAHNNVHSEHGALRGEHPGRSRNPVIKVRDLAWLEFEKPDLVAAESFAHAFGFQTVARTSDELQLRGADAGAPCVLIHRGTQTRFRGMAFAATDDVDVHTLAEAHGAPTTPLPDSLGGLSVQLADPGGIPVKIVAGLHELPALAAQPEHVFNFGHQTTRTNIAQRPPRSPAVLQRLGHLVLHSSKYLEPPNCYPDTFALTLSHSTSFPA